MTKKLQYWLFPPTCLLCGDAGESERDLCRDCRADLPANDSACPRCAIPLGSGAPAGSECGQCQRTPPAFDRAFVPLLYRPPVDFLIQGLKFHGRLAAARLLGESLGEALARRDATLPECVIPVPLHPRRLRERGFNQALELARPVARRLGIPLLADCARRARPTPPQSRLDLQTRRANVRGAFSVSRPIVTRHVAILDDVITTASTVNELAAVLRRAGVREIEVWACARTPQDG